MIKMLTSGGTTIQIRIPRAIDLFAELKSKGLVPIAKDYERMVLGCSYVLAIVSWSLTCSGRKINRFRPIFARNGGQQTQTTEREPSFIYQCSFKQISRLCIRHLQTVSLGNKCTEKTTAKAMGRSSRRSVC